MVFFALLRAEITKTPVVRRREEEEEGCGDWIQMSHRNYMDPYWIQLTHRNFQRLRVNKKTKNTEHEHELLKRCHNFYFIKNLQFFELLYCKDKLWWLVHKMCFARESNWFPSYVPGPLRSRTPCRLPADPHSWPSLCHRFEPRKLSKYVDRQFMLLFINKTIRLFCKWKER